MLHENFMAPSSLKFYITGTGNFAVFAAVTFTLTQLASCLIYARAFVP